MSLEQLEHQIELATYAMERARSRGDRSAEVRMKDELISFQQVLDKSRARLKELAAAKKRCDDMSASRQKKKRKNKLSLRTSTSKKKDLVESTKEKAMKQERAKQAKAEEEKRKARKAERSKIEIELEKAKQELARLERIEREQREQEKEKQEKIKQQRAKDMKTNQEKAKNEKIKAAEISEEEKPSALKNSKSAEDDGSFFIPWLTRSLSKLAGANEPAKEEPQVVTIETRDEDDDEEQEEEEEDAASMGDLISSFGSQIFQAGDASVSSLGSQVFGSSMISADKETREKAALSEKKVSVEEQQSNSKHSKKPTKQQVEERDEAPKTSEKRTLLRPHELTIEQIAEEELKAREKYIKAAKHHQELKKTGVRESSKIWKQSVKHLRDCYIQVEYWESLNEEASKDSQSSMDKQREKIFEGRDPQQVASIDFDDEESKTRMSYHSALEHHLKLVDQGCSTKSDEWIKSQARLHECLSGLQYWENRRELVARSYG